MADVSKQVAQQGDVIGGVQFPTKFPIKLGDPDELHVRRAEGIAPAEPAPERGLALKSLKLKRSHEGWFRQLFRKNPDDLYIVSLGLDLSGEKPFVWPHDRANAGQAWVEVGVGETHEFRLGNGYPIYLPRSIVGGLALSILVAESDERERDWWAHVNAAVSALNADSDIIAFVAAAAANPAGITVVAALEASAKAIEIVSSVLKNNEDDNVGSFNAIFPARGSWEGLLSEDQPDISIELVEVPAA